MAQDYRIWIETLAVSHAHLKDVVEEVGSDVAAPSYCSEWSIAQVLSHLGSGAEIGLINLQAALSGSGARARERYLEIWDVWNAKSPAAQSAEALLADARYVETLRALGDDVLDRLHVPMGERELDASAFVGMRLNEHSLHTWDIEVMGNAAATLPSADVELLIDRLAERIGRAARGERPAVTPVRIGLVTSAPERRLALSIEPEVVTLVEAATDGGEVELPAEALIRLVAGRLDPEHTPKDVVASGSVSLDELRRLFSTP